MSGRQHVGASIASTGRRRRGTRQHRPWSVALALVTLVAGPAVVAPSPASAATQTLTVTTAQDPASAEPAYGRVTTTPAGISCRRTGAGDDQGTCSASFDESAVVVVRAAPTTSIGTSSPATSAQLSGGGCDAGPGLGGETVTCQVTMAQARSVVATFRNPATSMRLEVTTQGGLGGTGGSNANGTVTASPKGTESASGISCSRAGTSDDQGTCTDGYAAGTSVTLTATPGSSSVAARFQNCGSRPAGAPGATVTCTVSMSASHVQFVEFTTVTHALTVTTTGTDSGTARATGTVSSSPAGISCARTSSADSSGDCGQDFVHGTSVTVTATATSASTTAALSGGGCAAAAAATATCTVTVDQAREVSATFVNSATRTLTVTTAGSGTTASLANGSVISSPAGIDCARFAGEDTLGTCTGSFTPGTAVTVTAAPEGDVTAALSGACTAPTGNVGAAVSCTVTMDQARAVTATFARNVAHTLTVTTAGVGSSAGDAGGAVTSDPAGIDCARTGGSGSTGTCEASYPEGATVTVTATPLATSRASLSGACTAAAGDVGAAVSCTVTMDQARAVMATFHDPAIEKLTVTTQGASTDTVVTEGTVTSSPAGISCRRMRDLTGQVPVEDVGTCVDDVDSGSTVTLTATPTSEHTSARLSGSCAAGPGKPGETVSCTLTVDGAETVTATFSEAYLLSVTREAFNGAVWTWLAGTEQDVPMTCPDEECWVAVSPGTVLDLNAFVEHGNVTLTGDDCDAGPNGVNVTRCRLVMDRDRSVTATFADHPMSRLTVTTAGAGSDPTGAEGVVTGPEIPDDRHRFPAIDCARTGGTDDVGTCTAVYPTYLGEGPRIVTITADPADGSSVRLACPEVQVTGVPGETVTCDVNLAVAQTVTATFVHPAIEPMTVRTAGVGGDPTRTTGTVDFALRPGADAERICERTATEDNVGPCSRSVAVGQTVVLTARPTSPDTSVRLSGGQCSNRYGAPGDAMQCAVSVDQAFTVTATFAVRYTLELRPQGTVPLPTLSPGKVVATSSESTTGCAFDPFGTNDPCFVHYAAGAQVDLEGAPPRDFSDAYVGSAQLIGGGCDAGPSGADASVRCALTMDRNRTVDAIFVYGGEHRLEVHTRGAGSDPGRASGTVRATPEGYRALSCSRLSGVDDHGTCSVGVPNSRQVTVTAAPGPGSAVRLDCAGAVETGAEGQSVSCTYVSDRAAVVTATFIAPATETLAVRTAGAGGDPSRATGVVSAPPTAILCSRTPGGVDTRGTCEAQVAWNAQVQVTAFPGPGTRAALSGACAAGPGAVGASVTCAVTMDRARSVTATFSTPRQGSFSCRASSARALGLGTIVANAGSTPCVDSIGTMLGLPLGLLTAGPMSATTSATPDDPVDTPIAEGDRGEAQARTAGLSLVVGGATITADAVSSHAEARCTAVGSDPALTGSTVLTNLRVNGKKPAYVTVNGHLKFTIGGVADVYVNHTATDGTTLTQRGLWIRGTGLLGFLTDITVAEAQAGFTGHPCG